MHWRRCRASLTDLKRLVTLVAALTLGLMVGLSCRMAKPKERAAAATTKSQATTRELTTARSKATSAETQAIAGSRENVADESFYVRAEQDIPVSSWERKAEGEEGDEIQCRVRQPRRPYYGRMRKFRHLPDVYLRYKEHPEAFPACATGQLLAPWAATHRAAWMTFLVKTAPRNRERRAVIRETWGSVAALRGKRFLVLFAVGRAGDGEVEGALRSENDAHGDLLQCDFEDSYRNLPVKVLSALRYLLEGHLGSELYTITDDDCVMHLSNIVTFFDRAAERDVMYCGFLYDNDLKTIRNNKSKWGIDVRTYDQIHYPTFCHGGMWTVTRFLMRDIYCMAEVTERNNFHLEDVYITGILREKLGRRDTNIQPALMASGRKYELMYYPWDESQRATLKMQSRWRRWNRTLPWGRTSARGDEPAIVVRRAPLEGAEEARMDGKWSAVDARRTRNLEPE